MNYVFASAALVMLLLTGCADKSAEPLQHRVPSECSYYSLQRAECLDERAFIDTLEPYQVIFVGDHHDSANAHRVVAELIGALSRRGYSVALANEWFSPKDNLLLQHYAEGTLEESNISKALGWPKRVGFAFDLYEPIYNSVIGNNGTLYGINMDKNLTKKISEGNVTAMDEEERDFYAGLDLNVSAHRQQLSPFFSHCHHRKNGESSQQCSERMYRVQVAWDSMMGRESAKLAERLKADEKLIVFVGAMHLESTLGVNLRFSRMTDMPSATLLPMPRGKEASKELSVEVGSSDLLYLYDND